MLNHQYTDEQLNAARYAVEESANIRELTKKVAAAFQRVFHNDHPKEYWGVTYHLKDDQVSADIETPFGRARSRLLIGIDDDGIRGRYVVEKELVDSAGQVRWDPVWALRVGKYGRIKTADGEGPELEVSHPIFGADRIGHAALSMLVAIGRGPELKA